MATTTQRRTRTATRTDTDGHGQATPPAEQPPRAAIWLQLALPGGSTQPVGIPLDAPDWEMILDNAVMQVRVLALRYQVESLRK